MSGILKYLTTEGAQVLREFSKSMPMAIDNMMEATRKTQAVYSSVEKGLGEHKTDFEEIMNVLIAAQKKAAEALEVLPSGLEKTASAIEDYLQKKYGINPGN